MSAGISLEIERQIKSAIDVLKDGGLVAFPTDTVYGIGVCFDNIMAVKRVYEVKHRSFNMGLPLLMADNSQIVEFVVDISDVASLLIKKFFPGGLTLVLHKSTSVPDIICGGSDTVAVRIPANPIAISLIRGVGKPIVGTSANISGKPSNMTAQGVQSQIGEVIDYIIDGGICKGGKESTIVDVTRGIPRLLREGIISRGELENVCYIE